jgi:hypothetical protein
MLAAMSDGEEHRRAPRTVVDVEALLHLSGLRTCPGVIRDLSYVGAMFVPDSPIKVDEGSRGSLRFALPNTDDWLEPSISVRRITTFSRTGGQTGQGIGLEFPGLKLEDRHTIESGCHDWDGHRMRQYTLAARVYVQSEGGLTHYARFGQVTGGTRSYLRLNLPNGPGLARGIWLKLKMSRTWIRGEVERLTEDGATMEVLLRIEGWGRDFFLHEARRQTLAST